MTSDDEDRTIRGQKIYLLLLVSLRYFSDQVYQYAQEQLMPRVLMANRHESESLSFFVAFFND